MNMVTREVWTDGFLADKDRNYWLFVLSECEEKRASEDSYQPASAAFWKLSIWTNCSASAGVSL